MSALARVGRGAASSALLLAALLGSRAASAADGGAPFSYDPPGQLVAGSGKGRVDAQIYAPGIRFPIETGPAFANSQVWGHGGNSGPANSSQCDAENFVYPWHDNYCETRTYSMPLCPAGTGHQGQDVRAADCKKGVHTTVAVVDGTITSIGTYSVYLTADDGTRFDYLHMQDLLIKQGQRVKRGDPMGKVSNQFGTSSTTVHLHFNIHQNVAGVGAVYVPPYLSLAQAYDTLLNGPAIDAGAGDGAAPPPSAPAIPGAPPLPAAPADSAAPAASDESGCAAAGPPRRTASFGAVLALLALGAIGARRRAAG
jgi:MYXO-CTERM domain-containing protein